MILILSQVAWVDDFRVVKINTNKQEYLVMSQFANLFRLITASTILFSTASLAVQQQGEPGSPGATTTIDGKQLPPPPNKTFGGKIEKNVGDSTPYWPPRVVPKKGAPNILLIMTDDAGYGVSSTFGGVIPTPSMDRIAQNGLRNSIH